MRATPYWIKGPWSGKLGILPRPRGGDWLEEEVRSWAEAGIEVVVSLLTKEEISDLDLSQESVICKSQGIECSTLAIPDRGVPASSRRFVGTPLLMEKVSVFTVARGLGARG
jgi:hypothetical protein